MNQRVSEMQQQQQRGDGRRMRERRPKTTTPCSLLLLVIIATAACLTTSTTKVQAFGVYTIPEETNNNNEDEEYYNTILNQEYATLLTNEEQQLLEFYESPTSSEDEILAFYQGMGDAHKKQQGQNNDDNEIDANNKQVRETKTKKKVHLFSYWGKQGGERGSVIYFLRSLSFVCGALLLCVNVLPLACVVLFLLQRVCLIGEDEGGGASWTYSI